VPNSTLLNNRKAGSLFGATLLAAALVMLGATFAPFVSQRCVNCPFDYTVPARSVFQGLDGWIVLLVVVALALSSLAFLASRRLGAALACAALAASALTLCVFERLDAAGRVLGQDASLSPVEPGRPEVRLHGIPPPVDTDFGFYVLLVSSIIAVSAALGVFVGTRSNRRLDRPALQPAVHDHPRDVRAVRATSPVARTDTHARSQPRPRSSV
jgi:hypothetical protein